MHALVLRQGQGRANHPDEPNRADTILFIDARHIYRQIDRAHREWTPAQVGFLANLVRLYRDEALDLTLGDEVEAKLKEVFGGAALVSLSGSQANRIDGDVLAAKSPIKNDRKGFPSLGSKRSALAYRDIPGLCKAASIQEIAAQGWSLNPGRYVGVTPGEAVSDEDFKEQLETLNEGLQTLNAQARDLEKLSPAM